MAFFFVFLVSPAAVAIALYRRNPRRFLDGTTDDASLRLLRWAVSLLSPQRAEWGRAMLGELGHLDGRGRRLRFALGCTGAALIMPPRGRAAAGHWATIGIAAAGPAVYAALVVRYRLGVGDWIALAVVLSICAGFLLGAGALLRRPGVALPGLLGGVFATVTELGMSGFTAVDQVTFIPHAWQLWVRVIAVPAAIGAAGTLWRRDPAAGRRIARLAALSCGLLQLVYGTVAVAVIGAGGPPDADGGYTVRGTVRDRLGNNIFDLIFSTVIIAMVGWAAAALAGRLLRRTLRPAGAPVREA